MRRTIRMVTTAGFIVAVALAAAPAQANDGRGSHLSRPPVSVFPVPRDPWKSWGVRSELPRRVGVPRPPHDGGTLHGSSAGHVWVPGHWAWDGATWVWWPGHWGVR